MKTFAEKKRGGRPWQRAMTVCFAVLTVIFWGTAAGAALTAGDIARHTQVTLIRHPGEGPRAGPTGKGAP